MGGGGEAVRDSLIGPKTSSRRGGLSSCRTEFNPTATQAGRKSAPADPMADHGRLFSGFPPPKLSLSRRSVRTGVPACPGADGAACVRARSLACRAARTGRPGGTRSGRPLSASRPSRPLQTAWGCALRLPALALLLYVYGRSACPPYRIFSLPHYNLPLDGGPVPPPPPSPSSSAAS